MGADSSTLSSIQKNLIVLEPYSEDQLYAILSARAQEALREGCVENEAIRLAAKLAAEFGDARYALDLLYRAGKLVDLRDVGRILPEHVRLARAHLPPHLRKEELSYLDLHEKLILLAVAGLLKRSLRAAATMGETEEAYHILCEDYGVEPIQHTQLWTRVGELRQRGLVETQSSGKGRRGRTTLISIQIPAESLEEELRRMLIQTSSRR